MSVVCKMVGSNNHSDEYLAALKLQSIFEAGLSEKVIGEITIIPNVTLFGQAVKDIDILVVGRFQNLKMSLNTKDETDAFSINIVDIIDFCTVIELKKHYISSIKRVGSDFFVPYKEGDHNVTQQSNLQKIACLNYIRSMSNNASSPFVTNLIWFSEVTDEEIKPIISINGKVVRTNVMTGDVTVRDFFQLIAWQLSMKKISNGNQIMRAYVPDGMGNFMSFFDVAKAEMGELTRRRVELITAKTIESSMTYSDDGILIVRGKAGTGKTVGLIQTAIKIVDEKDERVLILTYNRALVSDVRRLFAFAELPDMFNESCVHIETMQKFFYRIIKNGLYEGDLDGDDFIENYSRYIGELVDFLQSDDGAKRLLMEILNKDSFFRWDYCLVDEGQDWSPEEQSALLLLFEKNKIIVADGGLQFVRKNEVCDWSLIEERKTIKLKQCLRQKNNLVSFINHFLEKNNMTSQRLITNNKLPGGRVIISKYDEKFFDVISHEIKTVKHAGNTPYDMLLFVPSQYVNKDNRCFVDYKKFITHNIPVWDGTIPSNRIDYSISSEEIRVLQYQSGRGLEAWTVVCLELDTFVENVIHSYDEHGVTDVLALESEHDKQMKYLVNWIMIPLTRAIDTLIITLKNNDSTIGRMLKQLSDEYPEYIHMQ